MENGNCQEREWGGVFTYAEMACSNIIAVRGLALVGYEFDGWLTACMLL